jgi:uncharacterized protein with LGFP repeats
LQWAKFQSQIIIVIWKIQRELPMKNEFIKKFKLASSETLQAKHLMLCINGLLLFLFASTALAQPAPKALGRVGHFIDEKYQTLGGPAGVMGAPLGNLQAANYGGLYRQYQRGYIFWHPKMGAHMAHGEIAEKYRSMGLEKSVLGYPAKDQERARAARLKNMANAHQVLGSRTFFENGVILTHPTFGTHAITGPIAVKWHQLESGKVPVGFLPSDPVGFPTSDENGTVGGGRRANFQSGMIVWHPQTGAFSVYGEIGKKWLASGGESGPCGFPVSDEKDVVGPGVSSRTRLSSFQHGYILWRSNGNIIDMQCDPNKAPASPPGHGGGGGGAGIS